MLPQPMHVLQQLVRAEEAAMREVVSFETSEPKGFGRKVAHQFRIRQQGRARSFVLAPGARKDNMHARVRIEQALQVAPQQVAAFRFGQQPGEFLPCFREDLSQSVQEPVDLALPPKENPAQQKAAAALRVSLPVREAKRAAPRTSEDQPALDAEVVAQQFDVGDQLLRGV